MSQKSPMLPVGWHGVKVKTSTEWHNHAARAGLVRSPDGRVVGANIRSDFPAPALWKFARRTPDPERMNGHAGFTRVVLGGRILPDETYCTAALEAAGLAYERIDAIRPTTSIEAAVKLGELEAVQKFTLQIGHAPGEFLSDNIADDLASVPADWYAECEAYVDLMPEPGDVEVPDVMTPLLTNAGSPFYLPGIGPQLASAAMYLGDFDRSLTFAKRVHESLGAPEFTALAYAFNSRYGATDKAWQMWEEGPFAEWRWRDEISGAFPRRRAVYMGSKVGILATEPLAKIMKTARMRLPGLYHDAARSQRWYDAFWNHTGDKYESDISAFDKSMRAKLQDTMETVLLRRFHSHPKIVSAIHAWRAIEALGVVYPGYATESPGGATYVSVNGGTKSGHLLTTEINTMTAMVCLLTAVRRMTGRSGTQAWVNGEVVIMDQGDDQLFSIHGADTSVIIETFAQVGLKVKVIKGLRFLAKHILPTGPVPIGGRIIQQTLSNEWEPTGRHAIPLLALGLESRWGVGPAPMMVDIVVDALRTSALAHEFGIINGPTATAYKMSPDGRKALAAALAAKADEAMVEKLYRDAPFSATAAELLAALIAANPAALESMLSVTRSGWQRIRMMHTLSESQRFDYIMHIASILSSSAPSEAADTYALSAFNV